MSVLLATGLSQVEERLEKEGMWRCHHRSVLIQVVQETKSDVIVISPHLKGDDDLFEIIKVLRKSNIRVIFLPGTTGMQDTSEWVKQLLPWGVYCYVFDPVTPGKILERIKNPGKIIDLPTAMTNVAELPDDEIPALPVIVKEIPQENTFLDKLKELFVNFINPKPKQPKPLALPPPKNHPQPVVRVEKSQPTPTTKSKTPKSKHKNWFGKAGIITDGRFVKMKIQNYNDIDVPYDALVMPSSVGVQDLKKYRRKHPWKPVVVLNGDQSFLDAGADKCVKKINQSVIDEMTHLNKVIQDLWRHTETDPLTGLYTRGFLNNWRTNRESRNKMYTAVILDIDKFKAVNDTYGHDAGDAVLSTLGEFLKSETRIGDVVARYGGEEFVICMPDTTINEGYIFIDRLRRKWEKRKITLKDGRVISCTFSAGMAEWPSSMDVLEEADKKLYEAKNKGRNQVCINSGIKVLMLGPQLEDSRVQATFDPREAVAVISSSMNIQHAPEGLPLYIILSGQIEDWVARQTKPNAVFCRTVTEAINFILKPKPTVLPGARGSDKGMTIPYYGALYVVSPSRPALAGEVTATLCEEVANCALVCASPESMGAVSLGIPAQTLVGSDWRYPTANAPLDWNGIKVWPIDPYKYSNIRADAKSIVDQIKLAFPLVIIDCASSLDICSRVARNEGILILTREGDASDQIAQQWLRTYGGNNVTIINPTELPVLKEVENGFILARTHSLIQNVGG